jgi:hypothetical protein
LAGQVQNVVDEQASSAPPCPYGEHVIGSCCLPIAEPSIHYRPYLVSHQRLFWNVVEVKYTEILDLLTAFFSLFSLCSRYSSISILALTPLHV